MEKGVAARPFPGACWGARRGFKEALHPRRLVPSRPVTLTSDHSKETCQRARRAESKEQQDVFEECGANVLGRAGVFRFSCAEQNREAWICRRRAQGSATPHSCRPKWPSLERNTGRDADVFGRCS